MNKKPILKPNVLNFSAYHLKIIAIFAMLIDHIAWAFVPLESALGQIMHIIGRLTAPIMCFFIAEGFYHTKNIKKYALRLGIFALISHIPYNYFMFGNLPLSFDYGFKSILRTSIMLPLFLGLISLVVWNNSKIKKTIKIILIVILCLIAIPADWSFIPILWILNFGINHDDFQQQIKVFSIISMPIILTPILLLVENNSNWYEQIFHIGILLAIPFLNKYNGSLGGKNYSKWIFYIFYPLHMLVIGWLKYRI